MTRYLALATDYDGTLAHQGKVDGPTLAALERLRASGRKLVMVSGRELEDLATLFPRLDLFDRVVLENGALLYRPDDKTVTLLSESPPESFIESLRRHGVDRMSVGRVVVATWRTYEQAILKAIRESGLSLQVTANKEHVMVLPEGVNKATGLAVALRELGISPDKVVAVGDAENDQDLLAYCGLSAAVANAIDTLKAQADIVTIADHGAGVVELIDGLLADDSSDSERPDLT